MKSQMVANDGESGDERVEWVMALAPEVLAWEVNYDVLQDF